MARLLTPHDQVPDAIYKDILNQALAAAAADDSIALALINAETALNAAGEFISLSEEQQLQALRAAQGSEYFSSVLDAVRLNLYNHPAIWKVINYEGPSWQKGGYLHRGAGEIGWLPKDQ